MHAKGSGAYGTFTVTHDITRYTRAKIFSQIGKKTELFARFTTVAGECGAADALGIALSDPCGVWKGRNRPGDNMNNMKIKKTIVVIVFILSLPAQAGARSSEDVNKANNPLTPTITITLQDQYVDSYYGLPNAESNSGLVRGVLPHKLFEWPQILRATIPIVTSPGGPLDSTTGLGDVNFFDLFLFKAGRMELRVGPQLTIDSATDNRLGTGKWQAGAATVAVAPQSWGLIGGLVTYQHSFAGDNDR